MIEFDVTLTSAFNLKEIRVFIKKRRGGIFGEVASQFVDRRGGQSERRWLYSKIMAKQHYMPTLYNNRRNLIVEVLDYVCMAFRLYFLLNTRITEI